MLKFLRPRNDSTKELAHVLCDSLVRIEDYVRGLVAKEKVWDACSASLAARTVSVLWENANPTEAFSAQTVTLSPSEYDYLILEYSVYASSGAVVSTAVLFDGQRRKLSEIFVSGAVVLAERFVSVSGDKLEFSAATGVYLSTGNSVGVSTLVPQRVYGALSK